MIISADASALEWRVLLELSRDEVGITELLEKQDTHTNNQKAFNLPDRLTAKKYLFRTIYNRGKGYAFSVDPDFMHVSTSVDYWDEVGQKFYSKYKGIDECHISWQQEALFTGQITSNICGVFWPIPFNANKIPWTIICNYPVQGTAAEVMKIARVVFWKRLRNKEWGKYVKLISTVHDSIVVDSPAEYKNEVVKLFHEVFKSLDKQFKFCYNYDWIVPLDCECKAGPNFKEMEKVNAIIN
jgi:hypothetical protein